VTRTRWSLWIPLALFISICVVVAIQLIRPAGTEVRSAMIGKPVPEFMLPAASPDRPGLAAADLRDGTPKLLNIFGSWCVPCIAEAPQLVELERRGATIVGVDLRDHPDDLADFLAERGNPFARIGADDVSRVPVELGSSGVPESFVIDGRGVIRYQHIGDIRPEDVPMILQKLQEAGA
jgi:cytochrome c biogenesis protein CcmG/thiol:disulfide interchange protein DsbE